MKRPCLTVDPDRFTESAISPQTAAFNQKMESAIAKASSILDIGVQKVREARLEGKGPFATQQISPSAENLRVEADGHGVDVRIFRPAFTEATSASKIAGVYLHIHGGGWCLGSSSHQDMSLQAMADNAGVAVVSVDYRLAPEHPYPAGPDDCAAAARWLLKVGPTMFGTDRFVIGGDSAGAHLSVLTLLRLRHEGITVADRLPFVGANLIYGAFDLTLTPSARHWGARPLILSTPIIEYLTNNFLQTVPHDHRRRPEYSPLYADLSRLPPALFSVGTLDPLLDDSLMMSARWASAGSWAELAVYPGGIHGFDSFELPLSDESKVRQVAFIKQVIGAEGESA